MKQLLFTLILFLSGINILQAQETNPIEETTWNVIRERLFNGKNSKVFRFEDDIRIQLKGIPNHEDSIIFKSLIEELDTLTEMVRVQLVDINANFIISILSPNEGLGLRTYQDFDFKNSIIKRAEIDYNLRYINSYDEKRRDYYYYTIRSLTFLYTPKTDILGYGGIFYYQDIPQYVNFHEIDKNLIRKLYSNDFYIKLKENTIENYGYLYYWNLKYSDSLKFIFTLFGIVFSILGFYIIQSSNIYTKKSNKLKDYFKIGYTVLFWITLVYWLFNLPELVNQKASNYLGIFGAMFLGYIILGIIGIPFLYYTERFFINKNQSFLKKQTIIFITTVISIPVVFLVLTKGILLILFYLNWMAKSQATLNFNLEFLLFAIIIAILRVFFNFLNYRIQSMVNQKDVELAKMKELKNQAELNALHSRINPHFLYNSLNSIASLAHINPDKTENMAVALSEIFRYSINKENKTFVTVEEELEMVKKYLEIEKTRFGDKLSYTIIADEAAKEKLIPKFLIQPLAENAIKHGLSKITEAGRIAIEVKQLENDLVITIFDNGPDFPEEPVSGYGLQNLNDKLEIIYGKDAFINWENGDNKHFKIIIKNQFKG